MPYPRGSLVKFRYYNTEFGFYSGEVEALARVVSYSRRDGEYRLFAKNEDGAFMYINVLAGDVERIEPTINSIFRIIFVSLYTRDYSRKVFLRSENVTTCRDNSIINIEPRSHSL